MTERDMPNDSLLPSPDGSDDELVGQLQDELSAYRYTPRPLVLGNDDGPSSRFAWAPLVRWSAAASLLIAAAWWGVGLGTGRGADPETTDYAAGFALTVIEGTPRVAGAGVAAGDVLAAGERLVCDEASRVRLTIGDAGHVELGPGSQLLARAPDGPGWRLDLLAGELRASIFTAPRLFTVGTPAGLAVDMGCEYTARVEDDGSTSLRVTGGLVVFEGAGRSAWVPEGAVLTVDIASGPRSPVWEDLDPRYAELLAEVDGWATQPPEVLSQQQRDTLAEVTSVARAQDSLMLWHLLDHPLALVRKAALGGLQDLVRNESLSPPPSWADVDDLLSADPRALEAWREFLLYDWESE